MSILRSLILIIGDLRIVGNLKLQKLLTNGPNYRELRSINFSKAFAETTIGLDNCIEDLASKTKHNNNNFDQWKKMILENISLKIKKLETKIKPFLTKPILSDSDDPAYLATLHRKYVIVPIDKASNNFRFISKKFYISKILSEVGKYNNIQSKYTYLKTNFSKDDIIKNDENYCQKFDLTPTDKYHSLPIMYWLP